MFKLEGEPHVQRLACNIEFEAQEDTQYMH